MAKKTTLNEKNPTENKCLFIGPYGADDLSQKYRQDLYLVFQRLFSKIKAHTLEAFWTNHAGDMQAEIFPKLIDSALVIADLRGLNPNVMYEVGIRHAFNKPIILVRDEETRLPWDIDKSFILTYRLPIHVSDVDKIVDDWKVHVETVLKRSKDSKLSYSSFFTTVRNAASIQKVSTAKNESGQFGKELGSVLTQLNEQLLSVKSQVTSLVQNQETSQKLGRDDIIRMIYTRGDFSQPQIAKMFGLTPGRVSQIISE